MGLVPPSTIEEARCPGHELARIQRGQHGVFTHQQAIAVGYRRSEIETALARDRWISFRRGLDLLNGVEVTWEGLLLGDCLVTGGVASHRCGAALLGVEGFRKGRRRSASSGSGTVP